MWLLRRLIIEAFRALQPFRIIHGYVSHRCARAALVSLHVPTTPEEWLYAGRPHSNQRVLMAPRVCVRASSLPTPHPA